jgi:hypothetical protein
MSRRLGATGCSRCDSPRQTEIASAGMLSPKGRAARCRGSGHEQFAGGNLAERFLQHIVEVREVRPDLAANPFGPSFGVRSRGGLVPGCQDAFVGVVRIASAISRNSAINLGPSRTRTPHSSISLADARTTDGSRRTVSAWFMRRTASDQPGCAPPRAAQLRQNLRAALGRPCSSHSSLAR